MNIGFKAMFRCALLGVIGIMLPGLTLISVVGTQYLVPVILAITYAVTLGGVGGVLLGVEMATPKRDAKGRFVKQ